MADEIIFLVVQTIIVLISVLIGYAMGMARNSQ